MDMWHEAGAKSLWLQIVSQTSSLRYIYIPHLSLFISNLIALLSNYKSQSSLIRNRNLLISSSTSSLITTSAVPLPRWEELLAVIKMDSRKVHGLLKKMLCSSITFRHTERGIGETFRRTQVCTCTYIWSCSSNSLFSF